MLVAFLSVINASPVAVGGDDGYGYEMDAEMRPIPIPLLHCHFCPSNW